MEKKPIKRNENIIKLSRDHHASLMFCWKLRQGVKLKIASSRMVNYIEYFWEDHMGPHFREEEEILFVPFKDDLVIRAINEHKEISALITNLIEKKSDVDEVLFLQIATLVDDHVRFEERILFPHLEKNLTDAQLDEIGKQLPDDTPKDTYSDAFWIKAK